MHHLPFFFFGESELCEEGIEEGSATHANFEILFRGAEFAHEPPRHGEYLNLGCRAVRTEEVDIQLPVFAQASALGTFVAEDVRDGIPTQREAKLAALCRDHPRHGRGHFRAKRYLALPAVGESVGLFVDYLLILRVLAAVELCRLEYRGIVLSIAALLRHLAHCAENIVLDLLVFRIEIADALVGLGGEFRILFSATCPVRHISD